MPPTEPISNAFDPLNYVGFLTRFSVKHSFVLKASPETLAAESFVHNVTSKFVEAETEIKAYHEQAKEYVKGHDSMAVYDIISLVQSVISRLKDQRRKFLLVLAQWRLVGAYK